MIFPALTSSAFRVLQPAMRQARALLIGSVLAGAASQAIMISLPLLARGVLHRAGRQPLDLAAHQLVPFACAASILLLCQAALRWCETYFGGRAAQDVIAHMRRQMYRHLQRMPRGFYERRATGRLVVRFVGDANALQAWISRICVTVPADLLTLLTLGVALGWIRADILLLGLGPALAITPVFFWINPRARRATREARRRQSRLCEQLVSRIGAMAHVQAANLQGPDARQADELIDGIAAANTCRAKLDAWARGAAAAAIMLGLMLVVLRGAWLVSLGDATAADIAACLWLTLLARGPLERLARANLIHQRARVAVERMSELLARAGEPGWSETLLSYVGPGDRLTMRRVGYRAAGGHWRMRNWSGVFKRPGLNLLIAAEPRSASVVLELLIRVRRPHEGCIRFDGRDIRELRIADVRRSIAWIPRDCGVIADLQRGEFAAARSPSRSEALFAALHQAEANDSPIWLVDDPTHGLVGEEVERVLTTLVRASFRRLVVVASRDERVRTRAARIIELPEPTAEAAAARKPLPAEMPEERVVSHALRERI